MSFADAVTAVESFFADAWTETPVAYGNVDFDPPPSGTWIKLMVLHDDSRVVGLGQPRLVRHTGRVLVYCFVDDGVGTPAALSLADAVTGLFAAADLAGFVFGPVRVSFDGKYQTRFQASVTVPFWRDETG